MTPSVRELQKRVSRIARKAVRRYCEELGIPKPAAGTMLTDVIVTAILEGMEEKSAELAALRELASRARETVQAQKNMKDPGGGVHRMALALNRLDAVRAKREGGR